MITLAQGVTKGTCMTSRCLYGLRNGILLEFDEVLDALEVIQPQVGGTFYPTGLGFEGAGPVPFPDLFYWLIAPDRADAFEDLFLAYEDETIKATYPDAFSYIRWDLSDDGQPSMRLFRAPVSADTPMPGKAGCRATWARFWTYEKPSMKRLDISCNLVDGRCLASRPNGGAQALPFRVAPGKLLPLITLQDASTYRDRDSSLWKIYDGAYWSYILGTSDSVLVYGTKEEPGEKPAGVAERLIASVRRSFLVEARRRRWPAS